MCARISPAQSLSTVIFATICTSRFARAAFCGANHCRSLISAPLFDESYRKAELFGCMYYEMLRISPFWVKNGGGAAPFWGSVRQQAADSCEICGRSGASPPPDLDFCSPKASRGVGAPPKVGEGGSLLPPSGGPGGRRPPRYPGDPVGAFGSHWAAAK